MQVPVTAVMEVIIMENENIKRRRVKKPRQEWNPHWSLKILYGIWMAVFGALKIAAGAVALVHIHDEAGVAARIAEVHANDIRHMKDRI